MRLLSVAGYVIVDEMREDDDQFRFRSRGHRHAGCSRGRRCEVGSGVVRFTPNSGHIAATH
jgi:hypothetical protein